MRAARLNALDLCDTAELLYNLKRFSHSLAFSTLSIEESAKIPILLALFCGKESERAAGWRAYRAHRAKTKLLAPAVIGNIRRFFPEIPPEIATAIGRDGPNPDELETSKQRAVYSDCYEIGSDIICHQPALADWRKLAWDRLCEAQALALNQRDRPPAELEIWSRHVKAAEEKGLDVATMHSGLYRELLDKGFVSEGAWESIIADLTLGNGSTLE
jgi:AbiV family abortive infection protein